MYRYIGQAMSPLARLVGYIWDDERANLVLLAGRQETREENRRAAAQFQAFHKGGSHNGAGGKKEEESALSGSLMAHCLLVWSLPAFPFRSAYLLSRFFLSRF